MMKSLLNRIEARSKKSTIEELLIKIGIYAQTQQTAGTSSERISGICDYGVDSVKYTGNIGLWIFAIGKATDDRWRTAS
ncbi:hypothetical protein TNCV_2687711 [Trichonephila clavipes]|nr:hypothetical protein TNCV_2687711 [Trichonephila clavipes]